MNSKCSYLVPSVKSVALGGRSVLCASEKYNLPQGIDIADYGKVENSSDNDW